MTDNPQSPHSVSSCQYFGKCSGCSVDLTEHYPPIWSEVKEYLHNHGISALRMYDGPHIHWRCRAKLAVRGSTSHPLIGLFREGTHDVVPIPHCPIHHPAINQAVERVKKVIQSYGITPYNEQTGKGELRYLQFVVQRSSSKVQASFVLNASHLAVETIEKWKSILQKLGELDPLWHSLWMNFNPLATNTIFGPHWQLCYGDELLWEQFGDVSVCYQPSSFAQANLDLFEKMLKRLGILIEPQAKIAEFYAGVGVMGLFLAAQSEWIRCAEINPLAQSCFLLSRERLPLSVVDRISFHTASAGESLSILEGANVVVVDPPRKGLDPILLGALKVPSDTLKHLIYISCGWSAFKRDCEALLEAGWRLVHAEGYWFFPGTDHIEILASFRK